MTLALAPIRDKFERALRNGERLHLEIDQVRIIARTPIWPMLADLTAKELASLWESEQPDPAPPAPTTTPPASSSDPSGSGTEQIAMTGTSAGTLTVKMAAAVEQAERASEWEAGKDRKSTRLNSS